METYRERILSTLDRLARKNGLQASSTISTFGSPTAVRVILHDHENTYALADLDIRQDDNRAAITQVTGGSRNVTIARHSWSDASSGSRLKAIIDAWTDLCVANGDGAL